MSLQVDSNAQQYALCRLSPVRSGDCVVAAHAGGSRGHAPRFASGGWDPERVAGNAHNPNRREIARLVVGAVDVSKSMLTE